MQKVKIYNANVHPLVELFKGEEVRIEANDYWRDKKGNIKELDVFEANDFRGQYRPVPFDGSGKMINDPRYFKMIKTEPIDGGEGGGPKPLDAAVFKCMHKDCKHVSPSAEELEAHGNVKHPNTERLILPEQDAELKKAKAK